MCWLPLGSSSVADAIEARSTASEAALEKPAAMRKGRLGDATRQLPVVASCMQSEIGAIAPGGNV